MKKIQNQLICGDSREILPKLSVKADLIVTSPPYADARKNHYDSIHPNEFAKWFLTFNKAFTNGLKSSGSLVINIKDKVVDGSRNRFVWETILLLEKEGWYSIDDYIWHKTNPMPGFWPNRLRDGWEYCFHLSRSKRPLINFDEVQRPVGDWVHTRLANLSETDKSRHNSENRSGFGRDISSWLGKRTVLPSNVLSIPLVGRNMGHPAVFPIDLPRFFIKLLSPKGGLVIDPFGGSGTTGIAAALEGRSFILIDNNREYSEQAKRRLAREANVNLRINSQSTNTVRNETISRVYIDEMV